MDGLLEIRTSYLSDIEESDEEENDQEDKDCEDEEEDDDDFVPRVNFVCVGTTKGSCQIHWIHHGRRFKGFYKQRNKDKSIKTVYCHKFGSKNASKRCHYSFRAQCKYDKSDPEFWVADHWVTLQEKKRKNRDNSHIDVTDDCDRLKASFTKKVDIIYLIFVKLIKGFKQTEL